MFAKKMQTVVPIKSKYIGTVNSSMQMVRGTFWESKDVPEVIKCMNQPFTKSKYNTPIYQGTVAYQNTIFYGDFDENQQRTGFGFLVYKSRPDCLYYIGYFKKGKENGMGTRMFNDRTQQSGKHVNGRLEG